MKNFSSPAQGGIIMIADWSLQKPNDTANHHDPRKSPGRLGKVVLFKLSRLIAISLACGRQCRAEGLFG
jgi:hypothetical protein